MARKVLATWMLRWPDDSRGFGLVYDPEDNDDIQSYLKTPGEQMYLRLYGQPLSLLEISGLQAHVSNPAASAAIGALRTVTYEDSGLDEKAHDAVFIKGFSSLPRVPSSFTVDKWYGNDLSPVEVRGGIGKSRQLKVSAEVENHYGMGICRISYTTQFRVVTLDTIAGSYDPLLVWITGDIGSS